MEGDKILTKQNSHLYTRKGYEIENVSNRLIGLIYLKYKTRWGWSQWKCRWIEVFEDEILFYKYSTKRKHYKQISLCFAENNYKIGGLECDGEMFIIQILKDNKKAYLIKTPDESSLTLLYPYLEKNI